MSPLDATFLHIEDGVNHMHIASCARFEGPAPAYADLVELFRSKLPLVPRYRQKVRFVPGGIGRPVWVDDPHFRIDYHIRHTALPPPGTRRRSAQPDGSAHVAGAGSRSTAVGDLDGRGPGRRHVGAHLQGAPLHGRRHLRHRPDGGGARCVAQGFGVDARRLVTRTRTVGSPTSSAMRSPRRSRARTRWPGGRDRRCGLRGRWWPT